MKKDGVTKLDSIGEIFINIHSLFKEPKKSKREPVNFESCDPSEHFDKNSAMFIHDLLYISGPISHKELIEILKIVFGNKILNKVKTLLALLVSFDSIERNSEGLYRSKLKKTYFDYRFDIGEIIATFRNHLLKKYPERIYGY